MNNKAHTILVSIIASYGSRLTSSTANCKAFLADFMTDFPKEKSVLIELHKLQLTKVLSAFKDSSIDRKTLFEFLEQLVNRTDIPQQDLAWGVDAWANALNLDVKARRIIRKQYFTEAPRDLHVVTIRAAEIITEEKPEVPSVVIENANQAAIPRVAFLGVATLVSTFSIFQAVKSMLATDVVQTPVTIEKTAVKAPTPLPDVVVIPTKTTEVEASTTLFSSSKEINTVKTPQNLINVEQLSGKQTAIIDVIEPIDTNIEFAAVNDKQALSAEHDTLHSDIEAFLTQN